MAFSKKTRTDSIAYLKEHPVDLLIIGGGITGAGVAIQAAAAGINTALVEMQDFAEGTSSRSTKLVHGGIRYLKTFDVEVVADTVKERAIVQQIAPHIPKPDPMILPIYDEPNATFSMFSVKIAMDLYDRLANVTGTKYENYMIDKAEVLKREPQLNDKNLLGAGVYLDYRNNDARLVIENIKQAAADGAHLLSKVKVLSITHDANGQVDGALVQDILTKEEFKITAKIVINTAGPWSDLVRHLDDKAEKISHLRPTKGVHLVVDREKLNVPQPTYFDTGKNDGRMVFVIPREEKTYFGTTDTDYHGDFAHPTVTQEDVDYLLEIVNQRYPHADLTIHDIESSWAGLRPLISANGSSDYNGGTKNHLSDESLTAVVSAVEAYLKDQQKRDLVEKAVEDAHGKESEAAAGDNPSAVSRGSDLTEAEDGLVTLSGGKITDYRLMAEGALKLIKKILQEKYQQTVELIDSTHYPVSGGQLDPANVDEDLEKLAELGGKIGLSSADANYLANLYGSNLKTVLSYDGDLFPGLNRRESISLRYALAEEAVLTPVDFLLRRTNHILFMRDSLDALIEPVVNALTDYFNWTEKEKNFYQDELSAVIAESDLQELKANN
ncbi:type 1 glycerol-3-phosphate oxidase [Enterococcus sp. HY326]|uniref:type 1 glycerol-3-phosphate oxidase n=1 Tax=Enterococcus sp. HY326 TaxID=2971265 RepID=UPI00223FE325|nr:type 1 glycerol-3-phosphate oxidase [Enterococcus sp. HY326]